MLPEAKTGLLSSEESQRIKKLHEENKQFLCIPRRWVDQECRTSWGTTWPLSIKCLYVHSFSALFSQLPLLNTNPLFYFGNSYGVFPLCDSFRPKWDKNTSSEELKQAEKDNFLEWRRQLVRWVLRLSKLCLGFWVRHFDVLVAVCILKTWLF